MTLSYTLCFYEKYSSDKPQAPEIIVARLFISRGFAALRAERLRLSDIVFMII
jgi:hypothetical protein